MLAALGVGEIGTIVLMHGETQPTFEGTDVVFEEVGVFIEIDGFEGELAETLSSVGVGSGVRCYSSAAKFGAGSVLGAGSVSSCYVNQDLV